MCPKSWKASDLQIPTDETRSAELELVCRAQTGEPEAFGVLVQTYQRRAVSVAYRILGNIEDASDVTQDAFVRAYKNLAQLDDPDKFGGWLMRVVCNLSLNYRRSRANRPTVSWESSAELSAEDHGTTPGALTSRANSADSDHVSHELNAAIVQALEQLPDKQRLALILFSVEGLPQKEVAEILECTIELVKWSVFQARKKLKELLNPFL